MQWFKNEVTMSMAQVAFAKSMFVVRKTRNKMTAKTTLMASCV